MESMPPTGDYLKKHKLPESTHHLLISHGQKHYLLLLHPTNTLSLLQCQHEQIAMVSTQTLTAARDPVALEIGHLNTVCLLTKTAVYLWDFQQLKQKYPPVQIELTHTLSPSRLIHLHSNHFILASPSNTLQLFQGQVLQEEVKYPVEMHIEAGIMHPDRNSQGPIMLVPSTSGQLPYLLDLEDLQNMTEEGFLTDLMKGSRNYYMDDERVEGRGVVYCFSPRQKMVGVWGNKLISILTIDNNRQEAGFKYVLKPRLSIELKDNEPIHCWINQTTGEWVYSGAVRIGQNNPLGYSTVKKTVKQSDGGGQVRAVYSVADSQIIMVNQRPACDTKIHLCKMPQ